MKVLIIFGHPNPDSFNGAILNVVENTLKNKGHEYVTKKLYDQNFNAIFTLDDYIKMEKGTRSEDIALEQIDVEWADTIVFIYPIWWSGPPAMVKGWFDRVLTKGFAFIEREDGTHEGLLNNRKVIVFTTSASSEREINNNNLYDAMMTVLINGIFKFCGLNDVTYRNYYELPDLPQELRNNMLAHVEGVITQLE